MLGQVSLHPREPLLWGRVTGGVHSCSLLFPSSQNPLDEGRGASASGERSGVRAGVCI